MPAGRTEEEPGHGAACELMERLRVCYARTEPLRYAGSLDMQKVWERTFRRAGLPLAYSKGFHPQPRLQQAAPLPVGHLSEVELLDFWLTGEVPCTEAESGLRAALPPGIEIRRTFAVPVDEPAVQPRLIAQAYDISFIEHPPADDALGHAITSLLSSPSLPAEHHGLLRDLRRLIFDVRLNTSASSSSNPGPHLWTQLSLRPQESVRPEELVRLLDMDPLSAGYRRVSICYRGWLGHEF